MVKPAYNLYYQKLHRLPGMALVFWHLHSDLANTSDAYIGHIFGRIGSQQKVSNELLYG